MMFEFDLTLGFTYYCTFVREIKNTFYNYNYDF